MLKLLPGHGCRGPGPGVVCGHDISQPGVCGASSGHIIWKCHCLLRGPAPRGGRATCRPAGGQTSTPELPPDSRQSAQAGETQPPRHTRSLTPLPRSVQGF